jgi:signal transduction histidine kinase
MNKDILLVDDEPGIRTVLGISLSDLGYTVHTAENGKEALEIIDNRHPSIVLTDIKMPTLDGIELLKTVKARDPETEVIMLTGHGDMDLAIESLKFQATDFITKPISDVALTVALNRAEERIEMRQQLKAYTENLEHLVEEKSRKLIEVERLAAVGETVAGLSHTIKNIAGGLEGGIFVLGKGIETEAAEFLKQGWELVRDNVDRIKTLSLDLLNFAKTDRLEYRLIDPGQPAREVFNLMKSKAVDRGIDLSLDVEDNLERVTMDSDGIHQCLLNLVTNAVDACLESDPAVSEQKIEMLVASSGTESILYRVSDTCGGIDISTQERLFQRFFTTKGEKGTGIGLMLTRAIVDRHNGSIHLDSQPGKGACFTIELPRLRIER